MKVETYEIENSLQSDASAMAQDSEAVELIERLGLTGQKRLVNKETATRNPYRVMTEHERAVFEALMPEKTGLSDYSDDCLPLRVLQVAAHAKDCGLFERIEVWHPAAATYRDDPLLVGRVQVSSYEYKYHLLARWGRELMPFEQLEAMAVKVLRELRVNELKSILSEVSAHIEFIQHATVIKPLASTPHWYK